MCLEFHREFLLKPYLVRGSRLVQDKGPGFELQGSSIEVCKCRTKTSNMSRNMIFEIRGHIPKYPS